jgi:hypothetical protein
MQIGSRMMLGVGVVCAGLVPAMQARAAARGGFFAGDLSAAIGLLVCFGVAWRSTRVGR